MNPGVVADVDDRVEFVVAGSRIRMLLRFELTEPEQLLDPQQETGAANPTDQNGDLHLDDSTARRLRGGGPVTRASSVVAGGAINTPNAQNNGNAVIRSRDGMEMRRNA